MAKKKEYVEDPKAMMGDELHKKEFRLMRANQNPMPCPKCGVIMRYEQTKKDEGWRCNTCKEFNSVLPPKKTLRRKRPAPKGTSPDAVRDSISKFRRK